MKSRCVVPGCGMAAGDLYDGYCWKHRGSSVRRRYRQLQEKSKKKGVLDITLDEYRDLITDANCEYCNGELPNTGHGLDRIDTRKGYTKDNVAPCCTRCNQVKSDRFTHHQFKILIDFILEMEENGWRRPFKTKPGGNNGV